MDRLKRICKTDYKIFKLELYRGRLYIHFGTKYSQVFVKPTKWYGSIK